MTHVKFMVAATLGENLRPPIPKWSNGQLPLPIGKPRTVDNMASMFWVWHFKRSICVCWAVIGSDAAKNIFNVTIYKTLKLPLSTETLVWLNVIGWVGGSLLRCNYYHESLACEEEDFCERYILGEGDWELLSGKRLVILLKIAQLQLNCTWETKTFSKYESSCFRK